MKRILHVTPHLNGGLGRVLLSVLKQNLVEKKFQHEIVTLEPISPANKELFSDYLSHIIESASFSRIRELIPRYKIIQIEWWNHPLIYKFLYLTSLLSCRVVVSSHVSGFHAPQLINKNIVNFSDLFLATSNATSRHLAFRGGVSKFASVRYPVDASRFTDLTRTPHSTFNIGYVGTLDYSKLHPDFLEISSRVNIPDANFIICGEDVDGVLETEAQNFIGTSFTFAGFQEKIANAMVSFDIFGYPLNPLHFGTGEQVLIEAMLCGLPIVAFNNRAESEILTHQKTGLLVQNADEYVIAIEYLYNNEHARRRLGREAQERCLAHYAHDQCFEELNEVYSELLRFNPRNHSLQMNNEQFSISSEADPIMGSKIFSDSLGVDKNIFLDFLMIKNQDVDLNSVQQIADVELPLRVKTKGSIFQYLHFFPDDPYLNLWGGIITMNHDGAHIAEPYFKHALSQSNVGNGHHDKINRAINIATRQFDGEISS